MNLKSLLSICMVLLLILAFLTPGVMAKEDQKYYSNDFINNIDNSNAVSISKDDWIEIEEMVNIFLKEDGIVIENLDLSNLKKIETDNDLIFTGKIKYDVISVNSKSVSKSSNLLKSQEMAISSKLDKNEKSFKVESSSKLNQNYELNFYDNLNGEYVLEERYLMDNKLNVITTSVPIIEELSASSISPAKASGWNYPASKPPSGSIWAYNGKLRSLIAAGSIAVGAAASIVAAAASAGTLASVGVGVAVGVATWITSNLLPPGVSADFVYIDYYFTLYPRPFYNAKPALGYAHPTAPVYGEVDRYYVI